MYSSRLSRRQFLQHSSLIAMAPTIPLFLRQTARAAASHNGDRILVVVQLNGGNDGINTVVPFADEGYAKHREKLRLAAGDLIKLNDSLGLHPALRPAADLLEDGRLAIVQGVGYPNPNRSHEVSLAIWQTARLDPAVHKVFGWLGRATDDIRSPADGSPHSILLGDENLPVALRGRRSTSVSLAHLDDLRLQSDAKYQPEAQATDDAVADDLLAFTRRVALDARSTADLIDQVAKNADAAHYPETELAGRLKSIAQLIKVQFGTPVYYAIQDGYDTHAEQLSAHARLLRELSGAVKAFLDDLQSAGLADRVLVVCFSEFGRRAAENASFGTDHGTAGPVFIAGDKILPGSIGQPCSMTDLEDGDLKTQFDFRQIYAALLEDWLGVPSENVLDGAFARLKLIQGA